jgi:hypothetical protein
MLTVNRTLYSLEREAGEVAEEVAGYDKLWRLGYGGERIGYVSGK